MSAFPAIRQSGDYDSFLAVSARLGSDPLRIQAGGGNTSIKRDGAMWIKASGMWLAHALDQDIMVPVRQDALLEALTAGEPAAGKAQDFVPPQHNPRGLRPSIETTVHAVMPHPVVLHAHCVATIAMAIRADAEELVSDRLAGLGSIFVPYCKPGVVLAREIRARLKPDTCVIVLGNHGLVAGGPTPEAAAVILSEASRRLAPDNVAAASGVRPDGLDGPDYEAAADGFLHDIARDEKRLAVMAAGSYYPDHVIFLGASIIVTRQGETVEAAARRVAAATGTPPPLIFVPGRGAVVRRGSSATERAMVTCLADVFARVEPDAPLVTLTPGDDAELLNWDAEKYRRSLDVKSGAVKPGAA